MSNRTSLGHTSRSRTLLGTLLLIVAVIAAPQLTLAHSHLKASDPDKNATLTAAPPHVALTFSEPVELNFSAITIIAPDKSRITADQISHGKDGDARVLEAPFTMAAAAGTYIVEWRVLSADGHKMKGSFEFSIRP